jgi:hypothetical protein
MKIVKEAKIKLNGKCLIMYFKELQLKRFRLITKCLCLLDGIRIDGWAELFLCRLRLNRKLHE